MQSDRKKRTYIVTIEEQAEEKPAPAQDEDISKEPEPASGLEEVQEEPCKAEKKGYPNTEKINLSLAMATLALSVQASIITIIGLEKDVITQNRIILVFLVVAMGLIMAACLIFLVELISKCSLIEGIKKRFGKR